MRELFLRHGIEHIALVLVCVHRLFQQPATACLVVLDAGVVPRDDAVASRLTCAGKQLVKLQKAVTVDAGVGGLSVFIGFDEPVDDLFFEAVGKIKHIVRHAQRLGDLTRVLHIVERAAGVSLRHADILVAKQLHGCADAVIAALGHQKSGDAGIHSTAHGDHRSWSHRDPSVSAYNTKGMRRICQRPNEKNSCGARRAALPVFSHAIC